MTIRERIHYLQDENGCLSREDAWHVINDHGLVMIDYLEETQDVKFHVNELLTWLGY